MNQISEKILSEIESKGLEPKPKWQFLLKDCALWIAFVFCGILGGFAFGVILYALGQNGWELAVKMRWNMFYAVWGALPYFWIISLAAFVWIAYYNFKHTKRGYKYHPVWIVILSVVFSALLGHAIYAQGFGEKLDRIMERRMPFYPGCEQRRKVFWLNPDYGFLGGEITEFYSKENFKLRDFRARVWLIKSDSAIWTALAQKEQHNGGSIKMIGRIIAPGIFNAREIREWRCNCGGATCNMPNIPRVPSNVPPPPDFLMPEMK